MKQVSLFLVVIILTSCSIAPSEKMIQTAIAETVIAVPTSTSKPTSTPKPTNTPQPTLSQIQEYCNNYNDLYDDLQVFYGSFSEFKAFMESPSATWLELFLISPGISRTTWRDDLDPDGYNKLLSISNDLNKNGTRLQIELNRVEPPFEIKISHEGIQACISELTDLGQNFADFLEFDSPLGELPDSGSCMRLDVFAEDLKNHCK